MRGEQEEALARQSAERQHDTIHHAQAALTAGLPRGSCIAKGVSRLTIAQVLPGATHVSANSCTHWPKLLEVTRIASWPPQDGSNIIA